MIEVSHDGWDEKEWQEHIRDRVLVNIEKTERL